jgi:Protein kinase domain
MEELPSDDDGSVLSSSRRQSNTGRRRRERNKDNVNDHVRRQASGRRKSKKRSHSYSSSISEKGRSKSGRRRSDRRRSEYSSEDDSTRQRHYSTRSSGRKRGRDCEDTNLEGSSRYDDGFENKRKRSRRNRSEKRVRSPVRRNRRDPNDLQKRRADDHRYWRRREDREEDIGYLRRRNRRTRRSPSSSSRGRSHHQRRRDAREANRRRKSRSSSEDRWDDRHHRDRHVPQRRRGANRQHLDPPAQELHAGVVSEEEDLAHSGSDLDEVPVQGDLAAVGEHDSGKNKSQSSPTNYDDSVGHYKGRKGSVIADRYRVVKEVGVGTFGRVLQCIDLKHRRKNDHPDQDIVAIKVVRNVKRYHESAIIEANIIRDVNRRGGRGLSHCAVMYDAFSYHGHFCMVFESLGPSLYEYLKHREYKPFPISCVRHFAVQLLETLEFLHSFEIIHTDLKLENLLLLNDREVPYRDGQMIPENTRIKVIDFGGATYDSEKKSSIVNTRQYRAPEVILGCGWSMPSDLWSLGE